MQTNDEFPLTYFRRILGLKGFETSISFEMCLRRVTGDTKAILF